MRAQALQLTPTALDSQRAARLGAELQRLLNDNIRAGLRLGKTMLDIISGALVLPQTPNTSRSTGQARCHTRSRLFGQVKGGAALLFSFLLVFDLPAISAGVQSLGRSRLSFAYNEIAPKVTDYAEVVYFGWALGLKFLLFSGAGGELFKDRWVGL